MFETNVQKHVDSVDALANRIVSSNGLDIAQRQ